ncbi:DUF2567 domain-containing protein [Verrucosispora sioxanthis]|uniref:DUF2567 domain-containing protein n=1 Tax=Verrucosispora sioxanthis TaxID=2499994 RepID=UPI002814A9E9|nr:DUF2567 domain-containing protein [Verrucosispora sioxanthis]
MSPSTPAAEPPARPPTAFPPSPTEPTTSRPATDAAGPPTESDTGPTDTGPTAIGPAAEGAVSPLGAPAGDGSGAAAIAPTTPVVRSGDGAVYGQAQPEQPIAADGWFSLLGLAFGVLTALAVWFLLRKNRGPVGLVVAAAGALAAALVAWQVGRRVGLAGYQRLLDTAPEGTRFSKPADLRAGGIELFLGVLPLPYGNVLLPAFAAAVTYTLLAGWSRWPSLRPEPEPDVTWLTAPASGPAGREGEVSSGPAAARPVPPAAPEPPAPGEAAPPRG